MAQLLNIRHEAGDLAEYTGSSGSPTAATAAALCGTVYGLSVALSGDKYAYKTVSATSTIRIRVYFDLNGATGSFNFLKLREASTDPFLLYMESGDLYFYIENDSGAWQTAVSTTITDAPHCIEIYCKAATSAGANNGIAQLWIDNVYIGGLTNIDNDTRANAMVTVLVGALDRDTASGTIYIDELLANNDGDPIGPVLNGAIWRAGGGEGA